MLHPSYAVKVGTTTIEPSISDDIMDLAISAVMDGMSNALTGIFRIGGQETGFALGDEVVADLGYAENEQLTTVYTGKLDRFNGSFYSTDVFALGSFVKLHSLRLDRFYESKSAGDIVKELAKEATVTIERALPGITFPFYAIDSNKSGLDHLRDLAALCGFDIYANESDKLVFADYQARRPHILEYGKNVISANKNGQAALVKSVRVTGESPGGGNNSHWLTKKKVEKTVGSGKPEMLLQSRIIRDDSTAQMVAESAMDKLKKAFQVSVEIVGSPDIKLDDTVEIRGSPNAIHDGQYQVRRVDHFMNKRLGFRTVVTCRGYE